MIDKEYLFAFANLNIKDSADDKKANIVYSWEEKGHICFEYVYFASGKVRVKQMGSY